MELERLPSYSCMCGPACEHLARLHQVSPIKSSPSGPLPGQPDITDSSPHCCCHTCWHPLSARCPLLIVLYRADVESWGLPGTAPIPLAPSTPSHPPTPLTRVTRTVYPCFPLGFSLSPRSPPGPGMLEGAQEACFPL